MHFFCYEAYAFGVFQEGNTEGFTLTLSKLYANAIQYFLVLRAQRRKPRRHTKYPPPETIAKEIAENLFYPFTLL
jgi:hypothetical protein